MLEFARATTYEVGANRKGRLTGSAWRAVMPNLSLRRVLIAGRVDLGHLQAMDPLEVVRLGAETADDLLAGPDEMVWLGTGWARDLAQLRQAPPESRLAGAGATIVSDVGEGVDDPAIEIPGDRGRAYRARLRGGEALLLAPAGDRAVLSWLQSRDLVTPRGRARSGIQGKLALLPVFWLSRRAPEQEEMETLHCAIGTRGSAGHPGPPAYLLRLAADHGLDVSAYRWGLSSAGEYTTQKLLLPLFAPGAERPDIIVKVTRDAAVVQRLENERMALLRLAQLARGIADHVPRVLFAGRSGGLAVVGEDAIDGRPLRGHADLPGGRSQTDAMGPSAGQTVEFLDRLGTQTSKAIAGASVAAAVEPLLDRFLAIYRTPPPHERKLREDLDRLASFESLVSVFSHGDPGSWNVLVGADGRIVVLDWENAEVQGMPLWDLFYFLRSWSIDLVPRRIWESRRTHATRAFLDDRRTAGVASQLIARSVARLELPRSAVRPLFDLCWMYQALKEATRRPPNLVDRGQFVWLLRTVLDREHLLPSLLGEDRTGT